MPIDSMNKLSERLSIYPPIGYHKPSLANSAASVLMTFWRSAGIPTQGAIPTSPETPTNTTTGAFFLPTPGSGESLYLAGLDGNASITGTLVIYDRLAHMGGLNGTVTTAQTVNLSIATAASQGRCRSDGLDVEWHLEWYVDTGATAVTATAVGTDNNNNSNVTSQSISLPATRRASMCYQIFPPAGVFGYRSIQTVTLSASTGTAGNFGVTARRRLASIPMSVNGVIYDGFQLRFPSFPGNACIELVCIPTGTSTGNYQGVLTIISA